MELIMIAGSTTRATLDDLCREEGKAELIGGRIVRYMSSGDLPGAVAGVICASLLHHTPGDRSGCGPNRRRRLRRPGAAVGAGIGLTRGIVLRHPAAAQQDALRRRPADVCRRSP